MFFLHDARLEWVGITPYVRVSHVFIVPFHNDCQNTRQFSHLVISIHQAKGMAQLLNEEVCVIIKKLFWKMPVRGQDR